jgi:hypothetical protein
MTDFTPWISMNANIFAAISGRRGRFANRAARWVPRAR